MNKIFALMFGVFATVNVFAASPAATQNWVKEYVSKHSSPDKPIVGDIPLTDADGNPGTLTFTFTQATNDGIRVVSSDVPGINAGLVFARGKDSFGSAMFYCKTNVECSVITAKREQTGLVIPKSAGWWETNIVGNVTNVSYVGSITNAVYETVFKVSTRYGDIELFQTYDKWAYEGAIIIDGTERLLKIAKCKLFDRERKVLLPNTMALRKSWFLELLFPSALAVEWPTYELIKDPAWYDYDYEKIMSEETYTYYYRQHWYVAENYSKKYGLESVEWKNASGSPTTFGSVAELFVFEIPSGHVEETADLVNFIDVLKDYDKSIFYSDDGTTRILKTALESSDDFAKLCEKVEDEIVPIKNDFYEKVNECSISEDERENKTRKALDFKVKDTKKTEEPPEPEGDDVPPPEPEPNEFHPPMPGCNHAYATGYCGAWYCRSCKTKLKDGPEECGDFRYVPGVGCAVCSHSYKGHKCRNQSDKIEDHSHWKYKNQEICVCFEGKGWFSRYHYPSQKNVPWTQMHDEQIDPPYWHEHIYTCKWCSEEYHADIEPHNTDNFISASEVIDPVAGESKCEYKYECSKCRFFSYVTNEHSYVETVIPPRVYVPRNLCVPQDSNIHSQITYCAVCDSAYIYDLVGHNWGTTEHEPPIYEDETNHNYGDVKCDDGTLNVDICHFVSNNWREAHKWTNIYYKACSLGPTVHAISNGCYMCCEKDGPGWKFIRTEGHNAPSTGYFMVNDLKHEEIFRCDKANYFSPQKASHGCDFFYAATNYHEWVDMDASSGMIGWHKCEWCVDKDGNPFKLPHHYSGEWIHSSGIWYRRCDDCTHVDIRREPPVMLNNTLNKQQSSSIEEKTAKDEDLVVEGLISE